MNQSPDLGRELRRPFPVSDHCYDCVEFYGEGHGALGCNAWPASRPFRCADYYPLPPVGIDGETGQHFPPSRMQGRKVPRELPERPEPEQARPMTQHNDTPAGCDRTPSPAANYGPDGERLCECGAALKKRRRCCDDCRQKRREEAIRRWQDQKQPATPVDAVSDRAFPGPRRHATRRRSPVDN